MLQINLIRMLIFLSECKNTLNNQKSEGSKDKSLCKKRRNAIFGHETPLKSTHSEFYCHDSNKMKSTPEEDKIQKTIKVHDETKDTFMIDIEELLKEESEGVASINPKDEYIQVFDETFFNLEDNGQKLLDTYDKNVEASLIIENKEADVGLKMQTKNSSHEINNEPDGSTEYLAKESTMSSDKELTILNEIIAKLRPKCDGENYSLNLKIFLFPEILTILYFKIKKGENKVVVENFFYELISELEEDTIHRFKSKKEMFKNQIKLRTQLVKFFTNNRTVPTSYISLYAKLIEVLESKFIKADITRAYNFINATSFLIIATFLLEKDEVMRLELSLNELQKILWNDKDGFIPMSIIFSKLDGKRVISKILEIREVCDGLLQIRKNGVVRQQAEKFKSYFDRLKKYLMTYPNSKLKYIDIYNFLQAFEMYKYTLREFGFINSTTVINKFLENLQHIQEKDI